MSDRRARSVAGACGIAGVVLLTAHFLVPTGVPPDSAPIARIALFARDHRVAILVSAWLQVSGAILYVGFLMWIVHLAGAGDGFAGRLTTLAGTLLVGLTLVDSALVVSSVQAAAHGHATTLRVSFDLVGGPTNDAVGRSFLLAPAILLPVGFVLWRTQLLRRAYGTIALVLGVVSQALGLVVLLSAAAFRDVVVPVLVLENVWLLAVAVALILGRPREVLAPTR